MIDLPSNRTSGGVMKCIFLLTLFACEASFADDVYLKTGFVFRNVQVVDTVGENITIRREGKVFG